MIGNWNNPSYEYAEPGSFTISDASNVKESRLTIGGPEEIIRIDREGKLFWRGREVETDDDFRSAMMDLATNMKGANNANVDD